jgi:hypothetical protein
MAAASRSAYSPAPTRPRSASRPPSGRGRSTAKASTAKMRLVKIAEEILQQLVSDPQAVVNITVEINAEFPNGVSDQVKRAVSENATILGFKNKTWE